MFITDSQLGANWELTGSGLGAELCLPPAQRAPIRSGGELGELVEGGQKQTQDWPALSGPQFLSYLPGFLKENCRTPAYLSPAHTHQGARLGQQIFIISKPPDCPVRTDCDKVTNVSQHSTAVTTEN